MHNHSFGYDFRADGGVFFLKPQNVEVLIYRNLLWGSSGFLFHLPK